MSMIAPFPSHSSPSIFHASNFPFILPKPIISGINDIISDTTNIFCQIRRILNSFDGFQSENKEVLNVLKIEVNSNLNRLSKLLKNTSLNLSTSQIEEIKSLKNDGKILLSELGESTDKTSSNSFPESPKIKINEDSLKEVYAQFNQIKMIFSKFLIPEIITAENIVYYVSTRKEICNDLMEKKIIIEQLMEKDGLKNSNYNIIIFVKEFERILQMITESTFQLEEAVKKFRALGNFGDIIDPIKEVLENEADLSKRKAEKIRRQLEHCQEIIDSFEIVCNNLTAQLSELAAISGDSIESQEPEYLIELQECKSELQHARQKFEKVLIKTPKMIIPVKPRMKEVSTNTIPYNTHSISTSTEFPKEIQIKEASEIPAIAAARATRSKQFFLGFLPVLFFGLIFLSFFSEKQSPNNWRRMYGPQLDYISLPPQ